MQSPGHQVLVHCTLTAASDDTRARWIEACSTRAAVKAQEAAHLLTPLASTSLVSILVWPNHFPFAFLLWLAPVKPYPLSPGLTCCILASPYVH